jgi:hypothetical protein
MNAPTKASQQTAVLACAPQALVLSNDEKRLILAHRRMEVDLQHDAIRAIEGMAEMFPRRPASGLRLVSGGVQ